MQGKCVSPEGIIIYQYCYMTDQVFLAIPIVSIAFLCESIFGFGAGLIAIPLLSLFLGVKEAVIFMLCFQLLNGFLLVGASAHIPWKKVIPMSVALIIGTIVGTSILSNINDSYLKVILSLTIFIFLLRNQLSIRLDFMKKNMHAWASVAGFLGGLLQGVVGMGGPALTMYLFVVVPNKSQLRSALIFLFFISSLVRVLFMQDKGLLSSENLNLVLPVLPFFFLALFAGQKLHAKIDDRLYRVAVQLLMGISAILLLLR